ncbi:hypothetical protein V8F33_013905 [Rhypophila sp. PSN 637]
MGQCTPARYKATHFQLPILKSLASLCSTSFKKHLEFRSKYRSIPVGIICRTDKRTNLRPCELQQNMVNPDFSFFALPAEIRLQIYSHLLIHIDTTKWGRAKRAKALLIITELGQTTDASKRGLVYNPKDGRALGNKLSAQLMRTCKLIHSEAAPILYSQHRFQGMYGHSFDDFFGQIGPRNTSYITDLVLFFPRCRRDVDQCKLVSEKCGARIGGSIKSIRAEIPVEPELRDFLCSPGRKQLEVFEKVYRYLKGFFPEVQVLSTMLTPKGGRDFEFCNKIEEIGWTLSPGCL